MVQFSVAGLGMLSGSLTVKASYEVASDERVDIKFIESTLVRDGSCAAVLVFVDLVVFVDLDLDHATLHDSFIIPARLYPAVCLGNALRFVCAFLLQSLCAAQQLQKHAWSASVQLCSCKYSTPLAAGRHLSMCMLAACNPASAF